MAKTKISKVAKDLNVAIPTVIEFLGKKGITVDDNPNSRIEDDVVDLLMAEFQHDKNVKSKSDQFRADRRKETPKPAPKPTEEIKLTSEIATKPRILGKLEFDANGNPIVQKPAEKNQAPQPQTETANELTDTPVQPQPEQAPAIATEPETPAAKPEAEANAQPVEQPEAKQPEAKQPVPEAPATAAEEKTKAEETPALAEAKNESQSVTDNKPETTKETKQEAEVKPEKKTETAGPTAPAEPEVFVPEGPAPKPAVNLNIVGKIDLSAINQSTRPKKKSKEDKRNERRNQAQGQNGQPANGQSANADRKKRRRIGKEKIDIEKAGQQVTRQDSRRPDERRAKQAPQPNQGKGQRRPVVAEVSDEDVSKQVKETLARLTAKEKGLKKGAKWRKEKREASAEREQEMRQHEMAESRVLKLTEFVTANDLSVMMDVPVTQVIATCMNIGVMVSINQRLDAETINIVAEEFGFKTEYISAEVADAIHQEADAEEDLEARPPIVTVMGHVDHGKTSLLDYIRNANVIAGEAGGITQHIGAYNVRLEDGRHITFLDTPGHEAFTAMRARGAKVTDLCIIIVAADDNVMPQTVEAINHASAAGVPIVFAINKIDKPHANPEKIKEELAGMNYLVEDWGGKYQSQDISAKKGIGVNELMEKVLLEAELLDLKANPNRNATGSIIESSLDKGRGYVATVLVQNGTLRVGDIILAGTHFGKIKAMFNERNQRIKEAGPATPALILGLNGAPTAGDTFNVLDTEQEAREIANKREQLQREQGLRTTKMVTLEDIGRRRAIGNFQELNIIVKGDVDGSIEALSDSLIKLSTEEIQVNVLHKAVGEISESDVTLAAASDAVIIGFQVRPSLAARRAAERDGVQIRLYSVIYQAIEEVKDAMAGMLAPEIKEEIIGTAEVKETYHISKVGTIAGALVVEGRIRRGAKVRLIRDGIVRYTGDLGSLKRFKDDAKEVTVGLDCGLSIAGYNDIKVGDIVECFEEKEVSRTLD